MAPQATFTPQEIAYESSHYGMDKAPAMMAGSIVLIVLATVAVILRLVSRRVKKIAFAADDYMVVVALILAYGMFVSIVLCLQHGIGKHVLRVGLVDTQKAAKWLYIFEAIYPVCTAFTKLSILLLYRRIFTMHHRAFRYAMYIVGFLLFSWTPAGFFTTVFQCVPIEDQWNQAHQGRCIDLVPALLGLAVINTVVNASILILPMPMVWHLALSRKKKLALCAIFLIGSGDVMSNIIRTYFTSQLTTAVVDVTWIVADSIMLSFLEPVLGIICACAVVTRSLFRDIYTKLRSSKGSSSSRQGSGAVYNAPLVSPRHKSLSSDSQIESGMIYSADGQHETCYRTQEKQIDKSFSGQDSQETGEVTHQAHHLQPPQRTSDSYAWNEKPLPPEPSVQSQMTPRLRLYAETDGP